LPLNRLPDYLNSNISLTGVSADYIDGIDSVSFASALRANRSITGGGTITFDSSANLLWTTRFIVIANGRGPLFSTTGYFDIDMPPAGTVIPGVGGTANKTVSASGIPLNVWEALYYILPIGGTQTGLPGNFRVAQYTSDLDIPYNWVLIAVRNGDTPGKLYLNNGIILSTSQVYNGNSTSAYPYVNSLAVSPSAGTDTSFIEIGLNRTGNGNSYIDLIGDTTYSDFGLRIIRNNTGANTDSQIIHRGTGIFYITTQDAASLILRTTNTDRLTINSAGAATFTGTIAATGLAGSLLTSTVGTALGTAAAGTATVPARADHVHPTTGLGLTTGTLAQFAATTSAQLAGVISDETGSGSLVFATSPTFTNAMFNNSNVTLVTAAATGITNTGQVNTLQIMNAANAVGNDAFITFHNQGTYAVHFGLDRSTNRLAWGGWSAGANKYEIVDVSNTQTLTNKTFGSALALNYASPAITSNNASTASIFTSTVTGITIGSSSIRTTAFPADGTTSTAATGQGYMGMPQVVVSSGGRTLAATDAGKHIYMTTTSGQTLTIPANGTVAFPVGTTIVVVNANTISTSIAITTDTLRLANSTSTGTRTLASNGMCTLLKIASTEWIASGNGLT
jgi:hypothetical protein